MIEVQARPKLRRATSFILPDEPCLNLSEVDLPRTDSRGIHRFQILTVIRGDAPADYPIDMGPAKNFVGVMQLRIPGGVVDEQTHRIYIEHTVAELQEMALKMRQRPPDISEWPGTDLLGGYQEHVQQEERKQKKRRKYGY